MPSRNLPFRMMITHILRYFNIDLSFETPLLSLLILIALSSKGCKLALVFMPNPLQFILHHNLPLIPLLCLQIHTLLFWIKWTLYLWVTMPSQRRIWQIRKNFEIPYLMLSSRVCRLFHCQEWVASSHTLWIYSSTTFWGSFWALGHVYWAH